MAKVIAWLLAVALVVSGGMFFFIRNMQPLALGGSEVGVNDALASEPLDRLVLEPNGQVYVATIVRNTGRFPVNLEGIGEMDDSTQLPYLPVELRLGNGTTPSPEGSATFAPTRLDPGTGIGILVVFAANPGLLCEIFTEEQGSGFAYDTIPLRFTTYGIAGSQTLVFDETLFSVARPTQEACLEVAVEPA